MKLIYNKVFLNHDTGVHPENRKRLEAFGALDETEIINGEGFLSLYHTPEYIDRIKKTSGSYFNPDPDTLVSPGTYEAAIYAVGASVMASQTGDFALIRPPGHHAHKDSTSGFCIFNNIAIAAEKLVREGKKVLIFDFDGHLGDGTEEFFYKTNRVFYWSIHEKEAFPGGGNIEDIGAGDGAGFTLNIPLDAGSADDIYLESVNNFLPLALQFQPDAVAVSAGFDGYRNDSLLRLNLSMNLFYQLGKILRDNFPSVFAVLEGGYNLEALPKCVSNFISGVNGGEIIHMEGSTESTILVLEDFENRMEKLKKIMSSFWQF